MSTPSPISPTLVAIVVVRNGALPAGGDESTAEATGHVVLIGTGAAEAATALRSARTVTTIETPSVNLRQLVGALITSEHVTSAHGVVLPASPDGRDLAPLLAHALNRPLFASAMAVHAARVTCVRTTGRIGREFATPDPFVATLIPGLRGTTPQPTPPAITETTPPVSSPTTGHHGSPQSSTVMSVEVQPPDPATMDLTEAPCIVGGGLGLSSKERFDQLGRIGAHIGASLGGTRVASDAGWIPFERQIGTTGVAVDPKVYLAFGISGATQHTSGLGDPDHIISVNTDPSCPMMTMSDVAIVSDAHAVLDALERKLATPAP